MFDTPIGPCGLAWQGKMVTRVLLPESSRRETAARLRTLVPDAAKTAPPLWATRVIGLLTKHLEGQRVDLSRVPLAMEHLPPFHRRVYEAARSIAPGKTMSYVELATQAGSAKASRAVGQAMAKNPFPLIVPCHRVLAAGGKPGGFTALGGASLKAQILACEGVTLDAPTPAPKVVRRRGTEPASTDLAAAVAHLCKVDPQLRRLITKVGACTLAIEQLTTPFDALAQAIVYQQLTGKAAATIFGRLQALFDASRLPTPADIIGSSIERLRSVGLSNAKALALQDLAAHVERGDIPALDRLHTMEDDHIVEQLTRVRGVGRWTVEMMLIFRLGRGDVLPVGDYGVRKGYALTFGGDELPSARDLAARAERWRPYRSIASWYLWRAVDLQKTRAPG